MDQTQLHAPRPPGVAVSAILLHVLNLLMLASYKMLALESGRDVAYALLRAVSRLISTPGRLFCQTHPSLVWCPA